MLGGAHCTLPFSFGPYLVQANLSWLPERSRLSYLKQWHHLRITQSLPSSHYERLPLPPLPGPHICLQLLSTPLLSPLYNLLTSPSLCPSAVTLLLLIYSNAPKSPKPKHSKPSSKMEKYLLFGNLHFLLLGLDIPRGKTVWFLFI